MVDRFNTTDLILVLSVGVFYDRRFGFCLLISEWYCFAEAANSTVIPLIRSSRPMSFLNSEKAERASSWYLFFQPWSVLSDILKSSRTVWRKR